MKYTVFQFELAWRTINSFLVAFAPVFGGVSCANFETVDSNNEGVIVSASQAVSERFNAEIVGGGEFYNDYIERPTVTIGTKTELMFALKNAAYGSVIYIDDHAEIALDMSVTDERQLSIPAGVTLASGRGRNGSLGGLIYTNTMKSTSLFLVTNGGVRITGIRLRGPMSEIDNDGCGNQDATGIRVEGIAANSSFIIDNCELSAWPAAAVDLRGIALPTYPRIHHNHIHHNRRQERTNGCAAYGLGYGVLVNGSYAYIERNLFDHNRHDIASNGMPYSGYRAFANLIVEGQISHSFDVHGCYDKYDDGEESMCSYCLEQDHFNEAGDFLSITDNLFLDASQRAIAIRGEPRTQSLILYNGFRHAEFAPTGMGAVAQCNSNAVPPSCACTENLTCTQATRTCCSVDVTSLGCIEAPSAFTNIVSIANDYNEDPGPAWFVSYSGKGFWKFRRFAFENVTAVTYRELDGEPGLDAFYADGNSWYLSSGGRKTWRKVMDSSLTRDQLTFGNFDSDSQLEVFYASGAAGNQWQYWNIESETPHVLNTSKVEAKHLRLGNFNGNGASDVMTNESGRWLVSWEGSGTWQVLNDFGGARDLTSLDDLRFGDFNGDGVTDVFRATGSEWQVSFSGASEWGLLRTSQTTVENIGLCDFDGDGKTDVFQSTGTEWQVSWAGKSDWTRIGVSQMLLPSLALADVNGDGKCDVLSRQKAW